MIKVIVIFATIFFNTVSAKLYTFNDSSRKYSHVNAIVSSYRVPEMKLQFDKTSNPINFLLTNSEDIQYANENYEIILSCRQALKELGIKSFINNKSCSSCLTAVLVHSYETAVSEKSRTGCSSFSGATFCSSRTSNVYDGKRWINITIFDGSNPKPKHEINVASKGKILSVPPVARELCIGAFAHFPKRVRSRNYKVAMKKTEKLNFK